MYVIAVITRVLLKIAELPSVSKKNIEQLATVGASSLQLKLASYNFYLFIFVIQ